MIYAMLAVEEAAEPVVIPSYRNMVLHEALFWLAPISMLILAAAAILHARRSGHWSLKGFALAAVLAAVGLGLQQIAAWPVRGATVEELVAGARLPNRTLLELSQWSIVVGWACAAIAAVGSICHAVKLRRTNVLADLARK